MQAALRSLPLLAALTLVCGELAAPRAAAAAGVAKFQRAAVVDVQRIIMETKEGQRAKKELEGAYAKSQAKLVGKNDDLQKRADDLRARAPMLSEAKVMERQGELMRAQAELEQLAMQAQEEMAQKEALLTEKIYKKVGVIVQQIALEERLQIVLVRSSATVLYAEPKLDITNRVIVTYDKQNP